MTSYTFLNGKTIKFQIVDGACNINPGNLITSKENNIFEIGKKNKFSLLYIVDSNSDEGILSTIINTKTHTHYMFKSSDQLYNKFVKKNTQLLSIRNSILMSFIVFLILVFSLYNFILDSKTKSKSLSNHAHIIVSYLYTNHKNHSSNNQNNILLRHNELCMIEVKNLLKKRSIPESSINSFLDFYQLKDMNNIYELYPSQLYWSKMRTDYHNNSIQESIRRISILVLNHKILLVKAILILVLFVSFIFFISRAIINRKRKRKNHKNFEKFYLKIIHDIKSAK